MALFLPFKRAGIEEKVVQVFLFPAVFILSLLVMWPLVVMVTLSFSDPQDWWKSRTFPDLTYLASPRNFYVKYLVRRYDYWPGMLGFNLHYKVEISDADTISVYKGPPRFEGNWRVRARDGIACLKEKMPWTHIMPLYIAWDYYRDGIPYTGYTGLSDEAWKRFLRKRYRKARVMNRKFETDYPSFGHVRTPGLIALDQRATWPYGDPWFVEYQEFLEKGLRPEWRIIRPEATAFWTQLGKLPGVNGDIANFNRLMGTTCTNWQEVGMDETLPAEGWRRKQWEVLVRETLTPFYLQVAVDEAANAEFRKYLLARHGSAADAAAVWGAPDLAMVTLPAISAGVPRSSTAFFDWDAFVRTLPLEKIGIRGPYRIWREYLEEKYKTVEALNQAYGTKYADFKGAAWPQMEIDAHDWGRRWYFYIFEEIFKNYRRAWSFVTSIYPALQNTAKFAILFTIFSVITNTAAGYIMARHARGPLQLFIIYFLALAAFPIEAMAVPNFVMLRSLGLLNSVWALVLPMMVNGYYIYLMKTMFDSIPKEYFEEAMVSGLGNWRIFWHVALPFARPMIAVIAVYAFLWSYSNFMWAMIVCQKSTELVLPVYVFNLSADKVATGLLGALLVLVTIPPLAVFIFAQRTLQRSLMINRV